MTLARAQLECFNLEKEVIVFHPCATSGWSKKFLTGPTNSMLQLSLKSVSLNLPMSVAILP